jgi:hypothetical protein
MSWPGIKPRPPWWEASTLAKIFEQRVNSYLEHLLYILHDKGNFNILSVGCREKKKTKVPLKSHKVIFVKGENGEQRCEEEPGSRGGLTSSVGGQ